MHFSLIHAIIHEGNQSSKLAWTNCNSLWIGSEWMFELGHLIARSFNSLKLFFLILMLKPPRSVLVTLHPPKTGFSLSLSFSLALDLRERETFCWMDFFSHRSLNIDGAWRWFFSRWTRLGKSCSSKRENPMPPFLALRAISKAFLNSPNYLRFEFT